MSQPFSLISDLRLETPLPHPHDGHDPKYGDLSPEGLSQGFHKPRALPSAHQRRSPAPWEDCEPWSLEMEGGGEERGAGGQSRGPHTGIGE